MNQIRRILDHMLARSSFYVAAIALLASSCSSIPGLGGRDGAYESENQAFGEVERREDLRFPVLSAQPGTRPEMDTPEEVEAQYTSLVSRHDLLTRQVQQDIARARAERQQTLLVMVNGRQVELPLEEAIARLEAAKQADQAAAKRQTSQPMPKLGGKPPKSER